MHGAAVPVRLYRRAPVKKREARRPVLVKARMRDGAEWDDITIHNMSSRGLLTSSARALRPGTVIEIRRVHHIIIGRVVWARGRSAGIRTQDTMDMDAIIAAKPPERYADKSQGEDRRSDARVITAADIAARRERSQRFARLFQFVLLGGAVSSVAVVLALQVFGLLARTTGTIAAAMGGHAG